MVEILGMLLQLFSVLGIFVTLALLLVLATVGGYSILEWWRRRRTMAQAHIGLASRNESGSE